MAKKTRKLTAWEFKLLNAAWRYFEYGFGLASALFPSEIVKHFFNGDYSRKDCKQIAHHFWAEDHGKGGIMDWVHPWRNLSSDLVEEWCAFYEFCRAYDTGFTTIEVNDEKGKRYKIDAFLNGYKRMWISTKDYLKDPFNIRYVNAGVITKVNGEPY